MMRQLIVGFAALVSAVAATGIASALAQSGYDRPGGDFANATVVNGDPAVCASRCERESRCRAWSFSYPTASGAPAMCWLKREVVPRVPATCCVSGVRGAGVVEPRNGAVETSIDRFGGDYRSFGLKSGEGDEACKTACTDDNKCRAWTYARPGYVGKEAHCFLKKEIKPPRRKPGFISGVVR
jgi:hypothetical protein